MIEHPRRHFMGWHKPVVSLAVEVLTRDWRDGGLDLRDTLILVPTRNAGRRLREALAEFTASRDSVVFPGLIELPEFLFRPGGMREPELVKPMEEVAVWTRILLDLEISEYSGLFPGFARASRPAPQWAFSTARRLIRLKRELGENGLCLAEAARRLSEDPHHPEPERWADLARLEQLYLQRLVEMGRQDPTQAKVETARNPVLPGEIKRIKVFAVADPLPLAVTALDQLIGRYPVEIYIHARPELAEQFDAWGRPCPDYWSRAAVPIAAPARTIVLCQSPQRQAERLVNILADAPMPADQLAIGVADSEVLPFLERELASLGWTAYNPAGISAAQHPLPGLVLTLLRFLQKPDYRNFAALLRRPIVLAYLEEQDNSCRSSILLAQLDALQSEHLPLTWTGVREHAAADPAFQELHRACRVLTRDLGCTWPRQGGISVWLCEILQKLYGARQLDAQHPEDQLFKQAAQPVLEILDELDCESVSGLELPAEIRLAMAEARIRESRLYPDRPRVAVDLQGWLELAWEDAPYLVLTGMNEGRVPAAVVGDPFLPNSGRVSLGLSNHHSRFARDAFLLQTMVASRSAHGRPLFLLGKRSTQGDPLKPSRLFFLCSDQKLPERARRLFAELSEPSDLAKRQFGWRLQVPAGPALGKMGVTQFRDYLTCPFRFYLRHVLRMERQDDSKEELDALDFGNLCHDALELLGDPGLRGITDPELIAKPLLARLESRLANRFGQSWPTPLRFQVEVLRQRLRAAARCQAELHAQGWRVIETELRLGSGAELELAGIKLSGRIDRIDRHENGAIRILDYKTSESASDPGQVVWRSRKSEATRDYALVTVDRRERVWADLQLPLYMLLTRERFAGIPQVEAGYFQLPKAITDTGVAVWKPAGPELLESARDCAVGVIEDIRNGRFWPPADSVPFDDFADLFLDAPAAAFELNFSQQVSSDSNKREHQ